MRKYASFLTILSWLVASCSLSSGRTTTPAPGLGSTGWQAHPLMLTPRSEMPAAVLDGLIYVPGGFGGETKLEAYDPAADMWTSLPPLPEGRHHLMAAAHQGRLYVFGGARSASNWSPTDAAWAYDPATDEWTALAPMPEARLAGAAVSLGGYIYIVGGAGGTAALLRYDPAADSWSELAPLNQPREHTAAAALDDKIYAIAGRWEGAGELDSVEVYDPETDSWTSAAPLAEPRGGFAAAELDGRIVVLGGEVLSGGRRTLDSVEIFDPAQGTWSFGPSLPVPLHGVPAASFDGRLYVFGGSDRAGAVENRGRTLSISAADLLEGQPASHASTEAPTGTGAIPPTTASSGLQDHTLYLPYNLKEVSPPSLQLSPDVSSWVEATLAGMSLQEKVGQLIIAGMDGSEMDERLCEFIQENTPGGMIYDPENVVNPDQLRQLSAGLQECAAEAGLVPLLIATDHEGEYVNRFDEGVAQFPAALALGAAGDVELAGQVALASGQELAYSGVNMVLGPVADVLLNIDNDVISQRTYGGDPSLVSQYVERSVAGFLQAGVIPVLKHFPGHGGVAGDSHEMLPVDGVDMHNFEANYLPPYRSGLEAGAPAIMPAHIAYPLIWGSEQPATLSPEMVDYLRDHMDFDGIILSDSMNMKGVTGGTITVQDASLEALRAGVDMLLITSPRQVGRTHQRLWDALHAGDVPVERLDAAVRRILALKASHGLAEYPLQPAAAPDWQANADLALEAGRRAVTLYRDDAELVPIPPAMERILVIVPGTEWEFYPLLESALTERGHKLEFVHYPPPWEGPVEAGDLLESLPARASEFDLVLLFTWQVHLNRLVLGDTWQSELVQKLQATGKPLLVVAIKSPTDILALPGVRSYLVMFGTTPGQEQALLDALTGSWEPTGQNPLPGLSR